MPDKPRNSKVPTRKYDRPTPSSIPNFVSRSDINAMNRKLADSTNHISDIESRLATMEARMAEIATGVKELTKIVGTTKSTTDKILSESSANTQTLSRIGAGQQEISARLQQFPLRPERSGMPVAILQWPAGTYGTEYPGSSRNFYA